MTQPSFLARKTLGQPNYVFLAMAIAFVAALVPHGVWKAVESSTSRAEDWLSAGSAEVATLSWFHEQFPAARAEAGNHVAASELITITGLTALIGFAIGYACLRSFLLAAIVLIVTGLSAGTSLAIVYYFGACEVGLSGLAVPRLGVVDPLLMLMPVVVYATTLCVSLFLTNRYREICCESGFEGSAEATVQANWGPCVLVTLALAAALTPLWLSEIVTLQRFGLFTSIGLLVALALESTLLPVLWHCFSGKEKQGDQMEVDTWSPGLAGVMLNHPVITCLVVLCAIGACAMGFARIGPAAAQSPASLELVLAAPTQHHRSDQENAERDGRHYRMTLAERQVLAREVEDRLAAVPGIGETNSTGAEGDRQFSRTEAGKTKSRRELWRVAAQVTEGTNYTEFMERLKAAVDPVALAYQQRDHIVARLHDAGKQLKGARLCILYRTPIEQAAAPLAAQEAVLASLLQRSGLAPKTNADGTTMKALSSFNLAQLDAQADNPQYLEAAIRALGEQDALVLVSAGSDPTARQFAEAGVTVIDVSQMPALDAARDISIVFTGEAPLLAEAQRQLPPVLKQSILWSVLLVVGVVVVGSAIPTRPANALATIRYEKSPEVEAIEVESDEAEVLEAEHSSVPVIEYEEEELPLPDPEELIAVPARRFDLSEEERAEIQAGPHGDLHAKLRSLRRELPQGGVSP